MYKETFFEKENYNTILEDFSDYPNFPHHTILDDYNNSFEFIKQKDQYDGITPTFDGNYEFYSP